MGLPEEKTEEGETVTGADNEAQSFYLALINRFFFAVNAGMFLHNWVNRSLWMIVSLVGMFLCWLAWKSCDADWRGYANFFFGYKKMTHDEMYQMFVNLYERLSPRERRRRKRRARRRARK